MLFPYEGFKYNKSSLPELALSLGYGKTQLFLIGNLSKTIQKDIARNLEVGSSKNLIEFYNSGIESKVSPDLLEKINPKFMFTTKEKSMTWVSNGRGWDSQ